MFVDIIHDGFIARYAVVARRLPRCWQSERWRIIIVVSVKKMSHGLFALPRCRASRYVGEGDMPVIRYSARVREAIFYVAAREALGMPLHAMRIRRRTPVTRAIDARRRRRRPTYRHCRFLPRRRRFSPRKRHVAAAAPRSAMLRYFHAYACPHTSYRCPPSYAPTLRLPGLTATRSYCQSWSVRHTLRHVSTPPSLLYVRQACC